MLVPRFALSQTKVEVVVTVKLPYVRVGDAELSVVRVCIYVYVVPASVCGGGWILLPAMPCPLG